MAIETKIAITIRKPRVEIAEIMFDPLLAPAWMGDVMYSEVATEGVLPLGGTFEWVRMLAGNELTEEVEVLERTPQVSLVWRAEGGLRTTMRFTLEGIPEGAVVRVWCRVEPSGFWYLLWPFLPSMLRRGLTRDLRELKQFMESGEYKTWWLENGSVTA
jgi:hypothetical protein